LLGGPKVRDYWKDLGVGGSFQTESITKCTLTTINTR
jgi:hypothetical protein